MIDWLKNRIALFQSVVYFDAAVHSSRGHNVVCSLYLWENIMIKWMMN